MDVVCITTDKSTRNRKHILLRIIIMSTVHSIVIKVKVTRYTLVRNSERERTRKNIHLSRSLFRYLEKENIRCLDLTTYTYNET